MMTDTTIGFDELVRDILEHLAETEDSYRADFAKKIGATFTSDEDVLKGIDDVLSNPNTDPEILVDMANRLFTPIYSCDTDGKVTVKDPPMLGLPGFD